MDWLYVILFIIIGLLFIIFVPQLLIKRAMRQVVRIFRKKGATSPMTAMTLDELKLKPLSMFQRMMSRRDYKPMAMDTMKQQGIIIETENNKYYLSEEKLAASVINQKANIPPPNLR
jgi:hypothetical protein